MEVCKAMNWQKDGVEVEGGRRSDKEFKWIIKRSYGKTNKQTYNLYYQGINYTVAELPGYYFLFSPKRGWIAPKL